MIFAYLFSPPRLIYYVLHTHKVTINNMMNSLLDE
jgi:hypothetical protein